MKVTKYFAAIIIGLLLTGTVIAQPGPGGMRMRDRDDFDRRGPRFDRMMEFLELTDDQQAAIDKIHTESMKESLQIRNQVAEKRAQLNTLETAEEADMAKINKIIDEISVLKTKMAKMHAQNRQEVRALLTDEQRVKFDAHQGFGPKGRWEKGPRGKCLMNQ